MIKIRTSIFAAIPLVTALLGLPGCATLIVKSLTPPGRCSPPFAGFRAEFAEDGLPLLGAIVDAPLSLSADILMLPIDLTKRYYIDDCKPPTADELLAKVEADGARKVVQDLWDSPQEFDRVCKKIGSGNIFWLKVAAALKPGSDAGASESLNYAVARALPMDPISVLRLIGTGFSIDEICTSPFIEPEPGVAEEYQRRAAAALLEATPERGAYDLESVREECRKRIEQPLKR